MNTDARDLTDEEINEREALNEDYDDRYGMKIVQIDKNGSFNALKNAVFFALVLGMGATVWVQQGQNAEFSKQIAILQFKCLNIPAQIR